MFDEITIDRSDVLLADEAVFINIFDEQIFE